MMTRILLHSSLRPYNLEYRERGAASLLTFFCFVITTTVDSNKLASRENDACVLIKTFPEYQINGWDASAAIYFITLSVRSLDALSFLRFGCTER